MTSDNFTKKCKTMIKGYVNTRFHEDGVDLIVSEKDIALVWFCKTLQNWKAMLAVVGTDDGLFFEVTYNGDKDEFYLDVYKKEENILIKEVTDGEVID